MKAKVGEIVKLQKQTDDMIDHLNATIAKGSKQVRDQLVTILSENEQAQTSVVLKDSETVDAALKSMRVFDHNKMEERDLAQTIANPTLKVKNSISSVMQLLTERGYKPNFNQQAAVQVILHRL